MKTRKIGSNVVGEIGLGCMGMSWAYGTPADEESIKVLERSLELGVNHWDTADLYGAGANELLLAKVLKGHREKVFLATKFGNVIDRSITSHQDQVAANAPYIVDGTPEYVRKCCELSLQRLGVDHIDLYYQHRVDPRVPIEDTVGALAELKWEGKIKNIGLSEAGAETIRRAQAVAPIAALQTEFSLWTRDIEPEILPTIRELGISLVAYSPLGRGFLTGEIRSADDLIEGDNRKVHPRFQEEAIAKNLALVERVKAIAETKGVTTAQVALAWVLAQGEDIVPIPGTKRLKYLEQNCAAADVELTAGEIRELSDFIPVGERYPAGAMAFIDR